MKRLMFLFVVVACAGMAPAAHVVQTGSIAEGGYGAATAETLTRDGCGNLLNLFHGNGRPRRYVPSANTAASTGVFSRWTRCSTAGAAR